MRPAHKTISAGRLDSSRAGLFKTSEAALYEEHPNLVLRPLPFRRSQSNSQLLLFPKGGKVNSKCQQNSMWETSLSRLPAKSCNHCLLRPARSNQPASSKIA